MIQTIKKFIDEIHTKIMGYYYKKQIQERVGCCACKYYFTFYKHDDLCACYLMGVIDYVDGFYINHYGANCDCFVFDGNSDWFDWLE